MDPKIWGANMWASLVNIAKVYPVNPTQNDASAYQIFFYSLANVLPCFKCRANYKSHIQKYPIQLTSRGNLIKWLHKIYNQTRLEGGQKEISLKQFLKKYEPNGESMFPSFRNICIILVTLGVIFLIYYYFVYNRDNFPFALR